MSAEADVMEMKSLCGGIAELLTPSRSEKDRIAAVRGVFRDRHGRFLISWNRTLEFLRGKARRIDSWEKDFARRQLEDLKRMEQQRRDHAHLNWLDELIASDPRLGGRSAAELQHLLRGAGPQDGPVADATDARRNHRG